MYRMSDVIHAALHARRLTRRTRWPLYGCRRVVSGSLSSSLVPLVPNIHTHSAYSLRGSWCYMSCDGYHTTVETIVSGCNPWSNIAYGTDAPIATVSDNFSCLLICHSRVTVCVGHAMLLFKLFVAANKFALDGM